MTLYTIHNYIVSKKHMTLYTIHNYIVSKKHLTCLKRTFQCSLKLLLSCFDLGAAAQWYSHRISMLEVVDSIPVPVVVELF